MKKKFLVINGPNLNLLGTREPEIYGGHTLDQIIDYTNNLLVNADVDVEWFQSNIEGEIVGKIQKAVQKKFDGIVINPAAYSHTSIAILDALNSRMISEEDAYDKALVKDRFIQYLKTPPEFI